MPSKILLIFILVLILAAGFLTWHFWPEGEVLDIEEIEEADEEKYLDFGNWKSYRNEEYGFEFQYPQEHSLTESDLSFEQYPFLVLLDSEPNMPHRTINISIRLRTDKEEESSLYDFLFIPYDDENNGRTRARRDSYADKSYGNLEIWSRDLVLSNLPSGLSKEIYLMDKENKKFIIHLHWAMFDSETHQWNCHWGEEERDWICEWTPEEEALVKEKVEELLNIAKTLNFNN